jgi:signal transduction histidine kinase
LSELLDSVLSLYHGRFNAINLQVARDYDADLELFCFAGEIRQVFANLVGNSIDASTDGGRLMVRARRSRSWKDPLQQGIRFTVADTGTGMQPDVRKRAFEAFFTTKEVTGTGLGLWVSYEIVTKHHGVINVHSRAAAPGQPSGTTFQFFIPDDPNLSVAAEPETAADIVA